VLQRPQSSDITGNAACPEQPTRAASMERSVM
jgi:hypothetical protein